MEYRINDKETGKGYHNMDVFKHHCTYTVYTSIYIYIYILYILTITSLKLMSRKSLQMSELWAATANTHSIPYFMAQATQHLDIYCKQELLNILYFNC